MPAQRTFRFQAATVFLTYAQCPLTKETLLNELNQIFDIKEYCICIEQHSDGHPHLHAFLKLESKIHKRDSAFADLKIVDYNLHGTECPIVYHPNITAPRNVKAVIKYVQKDEDYIASDGIKELLNKKSYGQIINESKDEQEFLKLVEEHYPRDIVMAYDRIKTFAKYKFKEPDYEYESPYKPEDFTETPEMSRFKTQLIRPMNKVIIYIHPTYLSNPRSFDYFYLNHNFIFNPLKAPP